ncbi:MAG: inosine-5-monophosphate dehydrogenase, partial [Mesorhizobium sp.]
MQPITAHHVHRNVNAGQGQEPAGKAQEDAMT